MRFDVGITTTLYHSAANNLDGFVSVAKSFPSTAGKTYELMSLHASNVSSSDVYLSTQIDFNTGSNTWNEVPLTHKVLVPYQGALEIIDQSLIMNPQDKIRFASFVGVGTTSAGVNNAVDCWVTYKERSDTTYVGIGTSVGVTGIHTVFTAVTNPFSVNVINLTNYSDFVDIDTSVSLFRLGTIRQGYLVKDLTIPQNSTVQILQKEKRIEPTDAIVVEAGISSGISVNLSGRYIT